MRQKLPLASRQQHLLLASALLGSVLLAPASALAQTPTMAITNNTLTITGSGSSAGYSESASFGTDGVVEHIGNVPVSSGVGIPNFSFELDSRNITNNTSYEFSVYVVFDRRSSLSRLESRLTRLILNVDGSGNITGSIPAANNELKVIGRTGNGSVQIEFTVNNVADNGPVTLDGDAVTFNADNLIARIRNSNPQFDSLILAEFDDPATYDYRIVVEQTDGPDLDFSHIGAGDTLTPLPTVADICGSNCTLSTTAFELDNSEFAVPFQEGYSVVGSFTVGGAGPAPSPSSTPSPTPSPGQSPSATPSPSATVAPSATPSASPSTTPSSSASATPSPSTSPGAAPSASASPVGSARMTLQNNQLQISGGSGSGFSTQTPTISSLGVVSTVIDVPKTDGVGIPSFNFTILPTGVPNGTYNFRVGVTFDDNDNARRLEARIETLTLTVLNGVITGTIPAGQSLQLLGRNGSGNVEVNVSAPNQAINGPVRVTGGSVTFDAERLIDRIRDAHQQFDSIILAEFDEEATYTYRIAVQQTTGTPINFGTLQSSVFTPFPRVQTAPCNSSNCVNNTSAFVLNSNSFAGGFTNAYTVTGQFNVSEGSSSGGGDDDTPAPTPTPAVNVTESTTQLNDTITNIVVVPNATPSQEVVSQLNNAVNNTNALLSGAANQITSGGLSTEQALQTLTVAQTALNLAGDATQAGGDVNTSASTNAIENLASVVAALSTRPLTTTQVNEVTTIAANTVAAAAKLITDNTPRAAILNLVEATVELLRSSTAAAGAVRQELATQLQQLAQVASSNIIATLPASIRGSTNLNTVDAVRALSANSATVRGSIIQTSAVVPEPSATGTPVVRVIQPRSTATPAPSASTTPVPSATHTPTPTPTPSGTPSPSPSVAPSASPSAVPSASPSAVPSASASASPVPSATTTPSPTPSGTPSPSPSTSPVASPSAVPTASATPGVSPSASPAAPNIVVSVQASMELSGLSLQNNSTDLFSLKLAVADGLRTGTETLADSLVTFVTIDSSVLAPGLNAFAATGPDISVQRNATNDGLRISSGGKEYSVLATAMRIVPSTLAEGLSTLPDGRLLLVNNGYAFELAGSPADIDSFLSGIAFAGYDTTFRADGGVSINVGSNQRFVGSFVVGDVASSTECGYPEFVAPTGNPASEAYAFQMQCENGVTQTITPLTDSPQFYATLANAGLEVQTNRDNGVVSIANVGRFKPSFFVNPLSAADQAFLDRVKNADGVAFRARDVNGDTVVDYEVLTATGVQVLYGVAPN